jgi:hypothetical protein
MTDPLQINIPAAGVDTSRPLLPEGDYKLQITESNISHNEKLNILQWEPTLVTTEPATAVDSRDIPPNTRVYLDWPLDLAQRADAKYPDAWRNSLLNAVDACLGTDKDTRPDITKDVLDSTVGKIVIGTVKIDTDKSGVQRNKVTRLKKA